jgi:predicted RNA-binding Zn ribbon-like protein
MRAATPETIQLWGGALALDFANSVDRDEAGHHVAPQRYDVITEPGMLARWGHRLGVLAAADTHITRSELDAARALREAIHATFTALARGEEPAPHDLELIATTYATAVTEARLAPADRAWRLTWPDDDPRTVRFAVAADAVRLLGDAERLARVTRCPGRHCGWLFINASGRRRWCSMTACGSREKMRRMHARRALSSAGGPPPR